ncbi:OmpA family protein [Parahaliea sp. F7430]|uniref:OmpA family protein n=1 Tax=Sediminihaliea albiluteola TaxID=2758564 RepID=A0A7W2TV50_9GAMM|nr:OmpA family protein [Sediminihaliea albiluteola]MBA6412466.1 OmpA family protein [Sediminihaliea albiluteola]
MSLGAGQALAEPKAYPDGHGGEVLFPEGHSSFADEVVSYYSGTKEAIESARNPQQALGIPNYDAKNDSNYVSLGCGGELIVKFSDNILIDVPGPDLYVFEIGPSVEPTALAISADGESWTRIGRITGGRADVDIAPYVKADETFRYVKLVDLREDCRGNWPGADIDAVGAIGSAEQIALDSAVLFASGQYELQSTASAAIDAAIAGIDPKELQSIVVAGHTDNVGSAEINQELSQNRATAVARYLIDFANFPEKHLKTEAWGLTRPIASNDSAKGRAQNRRVEITLRRSLAVDAEATEPSEILGLWTAADIGIIELRREKGELVGEYTSDNGRIRGEMTSDTVLEGYWIEDGSRQRCDSEKAGSYYWGRLKLEFDSAELDKFEGQWSYCDKDTWLGKWPQGERII